MFVYRVVPLANSMIWYRALKERGVDTKLLIYNKAGHGASIVIFLLCRFLAVILTIEQRCFLFLLYLSFAFSLNFSLFSLLMVKKGLTDKDQLIDLNTRLLDWMIKYLKQ